MYGWQAGGQHTRSRGAALSQVALHADITWMAVGRVGARTGGWGL